jgi:hypothetical protein
VTPLPSPRPRGIARGSPRALSSDAVRDERPAELDRDRAKVVSCQSMRPPGRRAAARCWPSRGPWSRRWHRPARRERRRGWPRALDEVTPAMRFVEGVPPARNRSPTGSPPVRYRSAEARVRSWSRSGSGHHGQTDPGVVEWRPTHGMACSRATAARTRSRTSVESGGSWAGRSQPMSSSDRSGMRITAVVPSAAAPRYGATSGSARRVRPPAMNASRKAWSLV